MAEFHLACHTVMVYWDANVNVSKCKLNTCTSLTMTSQHLCCEKGLLSNDCKTMYTIWSVRSSWIQEMEFALVVSAVFMTVGQITNIYSCRCVTPETFMSVKHLYCVFYDIETNKKVIADRVGGDTINQPFILFFHLDGSSSSWRLCENSTLQ